MSSFEDLHVTFRYQDKDYNVDLVKGKKSDHSVQINGISYAVEGNKERKRDICRSQYIQNIFFL